MEHTVLYARLFRPDELEILFSAADAELTHTPEGLQFLGVVKTPGAEPFSCTRACLRLVSQT